MPTTQLIELGISLNPESGLALIEPKDRFKHLLLIGSTGSGKTSYFLNLIKNEIDNGIIVLDPSGDLAQKVAGLCPLDRLLYVDKKHPISLNCLSRSHLNKSENANELVEIINASVMAMTDAQQMPITVKMARIIRKAIDVMSNEQLNLEYLSNFLGSPGIRARHFSGRRPLYWEEFDRRGYQYDQLRMSAERVADRFSLLYEDENLRPFLTGKNAFDISEIAEDKKVVVFDLHGLDDEVTIFIGVLITHQLKSYYLHQARQDSPPVYFYCDEFHLFVTSLFERFLVESRKYNISMNFAGHSLAQMSKKLRLMSLNSCFVKVLMNCGVNDAEEFGKEFGIKSKEIMNLEPYHAIISIGKKVIPCLIPPPPNIDPYIPSTSFLRNDWFSV